MTVFSSGTFIRRAALAAATAFATPAFAQESLQPASAQSLSSIQKNPEHNALFRNLLTLIGYELGKADSPEKTQSIKSYVTTLQEGLNNYVAAWPDMNLPALKVDGILGPDTASLILRVVKKEGIPEVLVTPGEPVMPAEEATALRATSALLDSLQPLLFEGVQGEMISAAQKAFRRCTAKERKYFSYDLVEDEINDIAARAGYISDMIKPDCASILYYLPNDAREKTQIDYLTARRMGKKTDDAGWCKVINNRKCQQYGL